MDFKTGGRGVIDRLIEAYGFTTRQALCDHLEVSKSTLATRYMRDIFPAEWVVQCALETGVSLKWLTTGSGIMFDDAKLDIISVPRRKLINGKIFDSNYYIFDKAFLPSELGEPIVIIDKSDSYIGNSIVDEISDGTWLIEIDGKASIRNIVRIPGAKIKVEAGAMSFDCLINEVKFISKIVLTIKNEGEH